MMEYQDLWAELERAKRQIEALQSGGARATSIRVSVKGGVSVYGLGRFPVTLYKEQWTRLLDMADELRAFLRAHDGELKAKPARE